VRPLLLGTVTALSLLFTSSLAASDGSDGSEPRRVPRLAGGFGEAPTSTPPVAYVVSVAPSASAPASPATTAAAPSAAPASSASCPVRDPEDGACYPSADAADIAWLAKGPAPSLPANEGEIVEEDPDDGDADTEDGGALAPVDAPGADAPATDGKRSFWHELGRRFTRLVVRKADSRPASIPENELEVLFGADFPLPIRDFPEEKLRDSFDAPRGAHRRHHAIDLPAPRGTPVVAVVDGVIERIGRDRRGGKVCYMRDLSGRFTFYYAHLSQHQKGLRAGDKVAKGQRLGYVGATGHASGPHLHFAIFRQDGAPQPTKGFVLNPYLVFTTILGR
jgi:murein DD-endopeptidase MepM/ murein hydrolase activator NlpD